MNRYLTKLRLASLIGHPKRFLNEHSLIVLSKFSIESGNDFKSNHSILRKCSITLVGKNNLVSLGKADVFNSSISIFGTNNSIWIQDGVRIYNTNIIIKKATGSHIRIGNDTHLGGGTVVCAGNENFIEIGEQCMIAEDVEIWSSDTHFITINGNELNNSKPISVHNHVWLGKGVTVLKGVTIGENAIVGMRSLVSHDIRPGTVNAGIPTRELQNNANWHR